MIKTWQRYISFLLVFTMMLLVVLPIEAFASDARTTSNHTQVKFTKAQPAVFNPHKGEKTTIMWNFQLAHNTKVEIRDKNDGLVCTIKE